MHTERYWQLVEAYAQAMHPELQPELYQVEDSPGFYIMHYEGAQEARNDITREASSWALDYLDEAMGMAEPFDAPAFVEARIPNHH